MAVNINRVYQKVLAISNKEQRGYITPQEFNLLADRAQKEIYENYFHQARNSNAKIKDDDQYTDTLEMIEAKLAPFFKQENNTTIASNILTLPTDLYKIININTTLGVITKINRREYAWIFGGDTLSNKLKPLTHTPVYYRSSGTQITIVTDSDAVISDGTVVSVSYYKTLSTPSWNYVVLNGKALYNSNTSVDFELASSEEEPLVSRILLLSGTIIKQPDIAQTGAAFLQQKNQEQNS